MSDDLNMPASERAEEVRRICGDIRRGGTVIDAHKDDKTLIPLGAAGRLSVKLRTPGRLTCGKTMNVPKVRASDPAFYYRGRSDCYKLVAEAAARTRSAGPQALRDEPFVLVPHYRVALARLLPQPPRV